MQLPKTLVLEVTQEDIDKGIAEDCEKCPIALALIRALKAKNVKFGPVSVDGEHIEVYESPLGNYESYRVNEKIGKFVEDFDTGKPVLPFSVELEWLEPYY